MPLFLDVCEKTDGGNFAAISSKASCREAIEDTKTSEPRYDLQMARILAEAREKAQQEVGRNKSSQFAELVEGKGSVFTKWLNKITLTHIYIYLVYNA